MNSRMVTFFFEAPFQIKQLKVSLRKGLEKLGIMASLKIAEQDDQTKLLKFGYEISEEFGPSDIAKLLLLLNKFPSDAIPYFGVHVLNENTDSKFYWLNSSQELQKGNQDSLTEYTATHIKSTPEHRFFSMANKNCAHLLIRLDFGTVCSKARMNKVVEKLAAISEANKISESDYDLFQDYRQQVSEVETEMLNLIQNLSFHESVDNSGYIGFSSDSLIPFAFYNPVDLGMVSFDAVENYEAKSVVGLALLIYKISDCYKLELRIRTQILPARKRGLKLNPQSYAEEAGVLIKKDWFHCFCSRSERHIQDWC